MLLWSINLCAHSTRRHVRSVSAALKPAGVISLDIRPSDDIGSYSNMPFTQHKSLAISRSWDCGDEKGSGTRSSGAFHFLFRCLLNVFKSDLTPIYIHHLHGGVHPITHLTLSIIASYTGGHWKALGGPFPRGQSLKHLYCHTGGYFYFRQFEQTNLPIPNFGRREACDASPHPSENGCFPNGKERFNLLRLSRFARRTFPNIWILSNCTIRL